MRQESRRPSTAAAPVAGLNATTEARGRAGKHDERVTIRDRARRISAIVLLGTEFLDEVVRPGTFP